ncbi:MAG: DNA recombination protein RmuC [Pseudomonadota bacterium]
MAANDDPMLTETLTLWVGAGAAIAPSISLTLAVLLLLTTSGWIICHRSKRQAEREVRRAEQACRELALRLDMLEGNCDEAQDNAREAERALAEQRLESTRDETRWRVETEHLRALLSERSNALQAHVEARHLDTLSEALVPLKVQLEGLERSLHEHRQGSQSQEAAVRSELQALRRTSAAVEREAGRLQAVFSASHATRGGWGELVLERLLEHGALRPGQEYVRQPSYSRPDGRVQRPDVVLRLPDERLLFIDAKVSLAALADTGESTTAKDRARSERRHARLLRRQMLELAGRDYPSLEPDRSLPVALMFVPVDAALNTALRADPDLFDQCLARQVLPVSPTTLQITVYLIDTLWRNHRLSGRAAAIAKSVTAVRAALSGLHDQVCRIERATADAHRHARQLPGAWQTTDAELAQAEDQLLTLTDV